jgi:hypothetical protein
MTKLTDIWARLTAKIGNKAGNSGGVPLIADAFVKTFNRCPICDQDFLDHYFTVLNVIPTDNSKAVTDLLDKVKNHQWAAASKIREFEPSQDAIEVNVLRCSGGGFAVAIMEDPVELYHNPVILDYEVLDEARSEELRTVVDEAQWLPIR